jgi:hypothetical protein
MARGYGRPNYLPLGDPVGVHIDVPDVFTLAVFDF